MVVHVHMCVCVRMLLDPGKHLASITAVVVCVLDPTPPHLPAEEYGGEQMKDAM